jgi:hypothetical protein
LPLIVGTVPAAAAEPAAQSVPFVGCAGDGQDGPVTASSITGQPPRVPPDQAATVAYYAFHAVGAFAPQGWHCFGVYGSAGETLFVTPDAHGAAEFLTGTTKLHGPAVIIQRLSGDTSGRFEVAKLAARLFPVAKPYVRDVIAEGIEPDTDFEFAPYPGDTIHLASSTVAEFTTPAGSEGLGTQAGLAAGDQPITGAAIWLPSESHDMVLLTARLAPEQSALVRTILTQTERSNGSPKPVGRGTQ